MSLMALVDSESLQVYYYYYTSGGIPNDVNDHCVRVPVPDGVDYTCSMVVKDENGVSIVADPVKVTDKQWEQVRADRNRRLAECDWTQFVDSPLSQELKNAWSEYRQALRNIPSTNTDPTQVAWPTPPS
jgi:hypothetical protein